MWYTSFPRIKQICVTRLKCCLPCKREEHFVTFNTSHNITFATLIKIVNLGLDLSRFIYSWCFISHMFVFFLSFHCCSALFLDIGNLLLSCIFYFIWFLALLGGFLRSLQTTYLENAHNTFPLTHIYGTAL